jgi:hypothetical protein
MELSLPLHLFLHFSLAILTGYFLGRHFKAVELGIICGLIGGFLIDLDHVLEYFFVYGWQFNLSYFLEGRQFLSSDKIRLIFHAWEYLPLFLLIAFIFKKKKALQAALIILAVSASVHLLTDSFLNQYPLQYYALAYRAENNFAADKILNPSAYQNYVELREQLNIKVGEHLP